MNNNIWMFHRVKTPHNNISDIYKQRGMVHSLDELICLIDNAIERGYNFGSISEAIECKTTIHLTFDDGYKEHLFVAKELKRRYDFSSDCITFAINIRNSFYEKKLCMDMVYQLIDSNSLNKLNSILNIDSKSLKLNEIKKVLFSTKNHIKNVNNHVDMKNYFLNKTEVMALSELFSIASHCVNHCYLPSLSSEDIYKELKGSKDFLSSLLNKNINIICFPEGKHSNDINTIAKELGYKFGLSISSKHKELKLFNINRSIPRCT